MLQQELARAQKTIEKSKKISEVQRVLQDNESLQRKLISQEEEFRLQNQTLMTELNLVVSQTDKLELQLAECKQESERKSHNNVEEEEEDEDKEGAAGEKIAELEREVDRLRKEQLDRITDEFSLE